MKRFKLLVPPTTHTPYKLNGPADPTPDIQLFRINDYCRRFKLPPSINELELEFIGGYRPDVLKFYHLKDFFVVSDDIKEFMVNNSNCSFEQARIKTKHPDNLDVGQYWALKVTTRYECIIPEKSFTNMNKRFPPTPFSENLIKITLSKELAPHYANHGKDTYVSYPNSWVRDVHFDFSNINENVKLFEPTYWPHYLIVEEKFAAELYQKCRMGMPRDYFWTMGFEDIYTNYNKMRNDAR